MPDHMTAEQLRAELERIANHCEDAGLIVAPGELRNIAARLSGMAADGIAALPVLAYDAGDDVRIEVAWQSYCKTKWKVTKGGNVLANDGMWEWEPMPSSRDAAFLSRCRFDTPQAALACLKATTEPPHV